MFRFAKDRDIGNRIDKKAFGPNVARSTKEVGASTFLGVVHWMQRQLAI